MIPKIINYCWFGRGKKPILAEKCISSWKKFLPDYKIKEWNEDNFDVNIIPYTKEAYQSKKYAFVSDYARFWILYNYGGLYFDVDVEIIRPINHIIEKGSFMACENDEIIYPSDLVAPGLGLGAIQGLPIYKEILESYKTERFINHDSSLNLATVVGRVTNILKQHGFKNSAEIQQIAGVNIYPHDYMCPIRIADGKKIITENTVSIHHYAASWTSKEHRLLRIILSSLGLLKFRAIYYMIRNNLHKKD